MANTTIDQASCTVVTSIGFYSEGIRLYLGVSNSLFLLVLFVSLYFWCSLSEDPFLKVRKPWLLSICGFGCSLFFLQTLLFRSFEGVSVNCAVFAFIEHISLPAIGCPYLVRLLLWGNRVRFNFYVATEVAEKGLEGVSTNDPRFGRYRMPASNKFGLLLTTTFLVPYVGLVVVFALTTICTCDQASGESANYALWGVTAAILMAMLVVVMLQNRYVADTAGLRNESLLAIGTASFLVLPGIMLEVFDAGQFRTTPNSDFSWLVAVDLGIFSFAVITFVLPVVQLHFNRIDVNRKDTLKSILESRNGCRFYQLYLATEFSIENILFYKAVKKFEKTKDDQVAQKLGRDIISSFFVEGSILELNLSGDLKRAYAEKLEQQLEKGAFNAVLPRVTRMMSNTFLGFLRSDMYRLYKGEIGPDEHAWITSTGVSSLLLDDETDQLEIWI